VEELHHDRERRRLAILDHLAVLAELDEIEDAHDGAVGQPRGRVRLAAEPLDGVLAAALRYEELDADVRARRFVGRDPELRYPSEAGRPHQAILAREDRP